MGPVKSNYGNWELLRIPCIKCAVQPVSFRFKLDDILHSIPSLYPDPFELSMERDSARETIHCIAKPSRKAVKRCRGLFSVRIRGIDVIAFDCYLRVES